MKKLLALLICVLMISMLSVTAFAEVSPTADVRTKVEINVPHPFAGNVEKTQDGENVSFKVEAKEGYKFGSWTISGVEGVDYEIVSGDLNSADLVIKPINDVKVTANFLTLAGEVPTEPTQGDKNDSDKSPQTGDNVEIFVLVAFAAVALMIASKKQLIKD